MGREVEAAKVPTNEAASPPLDLLRRELAEACKALREAARNSSLPPFPGVAAAAFAFGRQARALETPPERTLVLLKQCVAEGPAAELSAVAFSWLNEIVVCAALDGYYRDD